MAINAKEHGDKEIELEWVDDEVRPGEQFLYIDQEDFGTILKLAEKAGWFGEDIRLKIFQDGDKTCVLCGDNLQEGIASFADDIPAALINFIQEWRKAGKCIDPRGHSGTGKCIFCGKGL